MIGAVFFFRKICYYIFNMIKKLLLIVILVALLGIAGVFLVTRSGSNSNKDVVAGDATSVADIEKATSTESQSVAPYPSYTGEPITFLGNDPIINSLPTEAVMKQKFFLSELDKSLKENPNNFDEWIAVGNHKKFFNNYNGARDAWEYAKHLSDNPISYLNLANLYGYYLRNLSKAEENYLLAIDHDSLNATGVYNAAAGFFRDFGMKDKALEYYQRALELDPTDTAVKVEIERLEASQ